MNFLYLLNETLIQYDIVYKMGYFETKHLCNTLFQSNFICYHNNILNKNMITIKNILPDNLEQTTNNNIIPL